MKCSQWFWVINILRTVSSSGAGRLCEAAVGEKFDVRGKVRGSSGTVFSWMLIGLKFCLSWSWERCICINWAALWVLSDSGCLIKSREQLFLVIMWTGRTRWCTLQHQTLTELCEFTLLCPWKSSFKREICILMFCSSSRAKQSTSRVSGLKRLFLVICKAQCVQNTLLQTETAAQCNTSVH